MADIQKQFEKFHATIRTDYEISSTLREKRDIVLDKIRRHLASEERPTFEKLLQGSYALKTGVIPIENLEYDIDVGLRFEIDPAETSAATARRWVFEAVKNHTKQVEDRGPCIRVRYEAGYHLDLVIYAVTGDTFHHAHKSRGWLDADPRGLLECVKNHHQQNFSGTEDSQTATDQFRRCVRYLRRWCDVRIPKESDDKPSGIAIVLLAIQHGLPRRTFLDQRPDDRRALAEFARKLSTHPGRLTAMKPTPEYEDVMAKLSNAAMEDLKTGLHELADALDFAGATNDPVAACKRLKDQFGKDFPVRDPNDTGRRAKGPAIVPSSSSA